MIDGFDARTFLLDTLTPLTWLIFQGAVYSAVIVANLWFLLRDRQFKVNYTLSRDSIRIGLCLQIMVSVGLVYDAIRGNPYPFVTILGLGLAMVHYPVIMTRDKQVERQ